MSQQQNNLVQSVFEKHYENLSESKQDLLNQKYNCSICLELLNIKILLCVMYAKNYFIIHV